MLRVDLWAWKGNPRSRRGRWLRLLFASSQGRAHSFSAGERGPVALSGSTPLTMSRSTCGMASFAGGFGRRFGRCIHCAAQRPGSAMGGKQTSAASVGKRAYRRLSERYVRKEPFGGHIRAGLGEDAFYWVLRERVGLSWRREGTYTFLYRGGRAGRFSAGGRSGILSGAPGIAWGSAALWEPAWPGLPHTGNR